MCQMIFPFGGYGAKAGPAAAWKTEEKRKEACWRAYAEIYVVPGPVRIFLRKDGSTEYAG